MNHITLAVRNLERSFAFYKDVLELKPLVRWDKGAYFLTQETSFWFCLNVDDRHEPAKGYTHYAFSVKESDFSRLSDKIKSYGSPLYQENRSPGNSLYFEDPDGHKLEIHTGNWQDRIASKREDLGQWKHVEWLC